MCRSVPQMALEVTRITTSLGSSTVASGTSSTLTDRVSTNTTALTNAPSQGPVHAAMGPAYTALIRPSRGSTGPFRPGKWTGYPVVDILYIAFDQEEQNLSIKKQTPSRHGVITPRL